MSKSGKRKSGQVKDWSDKVRSKSGQGQVWSCQDRSGRGEIRSGQVKSGENQIRLCQTMSRQESSR